LNSRTLFDEAISSQIELLDYRILNIALKHLFRLSILEFHHRDPFDRLIISQALVEKIPITSVDEKFDNYGIERIW
jgi:PIN domain nuclease of toxin-antitoxin system